MGAVRIVAVTNSSASELLIWDCVSRKRPIFIQNKCIRVDIVLYFPEHDVKKNASIHEIMIGSFIESN